MEVTDAVLHTSFQHYLIVLGYKAVLNWLCKHLLNFLLIIKGFKSFFKG